MLEGIGVECALVKGISDLDSIDALVLPGGESTTMGRLLTRFSLLEPIRERLSDGMPAFGTCAGLIMLAKQNDDPLQFRLSVLDIDVDRNAYGRQVESFEADLDIPAIPGGRFRGVFIRAPIVRRAGNHIEILGRFENSPILIRQHHILAASFHPELTTDPRVHELFLKTCM